MIGECLEADGVAIRGPTPLAEVWVPLDSGLTVHYGRNSAGKSLVLGAIAAALDGSSAPLDAVVELHLRFIDWCGSWDTSLLEILARTVLNDARCEGIDERYAALVLLERVVSDEFDEACKSALGVLLTRILDRLAVPFGLADGTCHSPRLALRSAGDESLRAWTVHLSVVRSDAESPMPVVVADFEPDEAFRVSDGRLLATDWFACVRALDKVQSSPAPGCVIDAR